MADNLDDRRDDVADQVFHAILGAQETIHLYLGHRLGLYRALAGAGAVTPADLSARAGIDQRYAREWLEQQAVSGILDVAHDTDDTDDTEEAADGQTRRYRLSAGAAEVLADPESLYYFAPVTAIAAGIAQALPRIVDAFRTGGGVPYAAYGTDLKNGIAAANRPMFRRQLAADWIPALPDIERRLRRAGPPAAVADLGCGSGWSTIALASAYPRAVVDGVDLDPASIEDARHNAADAGVTDRVRFMLQDAAKAMTGKYDLVTFFETLHDMAHPVEALRTARAMLAPGGAVLVGDERVAETFTAPGDDLERFNYGWSAPHCLAAALTEPGAAGTGTVLRPGTLRRYANDAGFGEVTILPIEHELWRFYRLDP